MGRKKVRDPKLTTSMRIRATDRELVVARFGSLQKFVDRILLDLRKEMGNEINNTKFYRKSKSDKGGTNNAND